jgi:hypothetical protein
LLDISGDSFLVIHLLLQAATGVLLRISQTRLPASISIGIIASLLMLTDSLWIDSKMVVMEMSLLEKGIQERIDAI